MDTKKRLLNDLLDITRSQKKCLDEDNQEEFYRLLNIRKKILLKYLKQASISPQMDDEERELKKKIAILHQINTERFAEKLEEVKKELRRLRASKQNTNKYKNAYKSNYQGGLFFDKRNG
ncbi:hypothetical protein [Candidatus Epulonipiscium viviparus]|uniref:hypothetical protein n=1 Tax=Candidatus Epulonipiscium viviparus TaxID=420336 RepID=UPI00016C0601|nr:hypothetical protein [Candidatus Epulopiscium viviparus]